MDDLIPAGWHIVGIGDFNGDGISDLLLRNDDGTVTDWLGTGDGGFSDTGASVSSGGTSSQVAGTGDFNGDGMEDILWRNVSLRVTDSLGQPDGSFVATGVSMGSGTSWHVAGVGDFNGDGRSDILWRNDNGSITDWLGQSDGTFVGNSIGIDFNTSWSVAAVGDFNGDGRSDILWRNVDGNVKDWLGQANGGFQDNSANAPSNIGASWHVAGAGDFNGDGRSDILWRDQDGTITDWLGQANGGFVSNSAVASQPLDSGFTVAGVGDFNGDHKSDMLLEWSDGSLQVWTGSDNGAILSPTEKLWEDSVAGVATFLDEIGYQLETAPPPPSKRTRACNMRASSPPPSPITSSAWRRRVGSGASMPPTGWPKARTRRFTCSIATR